MTDIRLVGVSSTIKLDDVQDMASDRDQDDFIKEVAADLEKKLRDMVADARPVSPLAFQVTGPHTDPIQGVIWVHTLTGQFDLDLLPPTCEAVRIHREGVETPRTERPRINLDLFRTRAGRRKAAKP